MSATQKQKRLKSRSAAADQAFSDPRFAKIQTDAVYRLPSKKDTHVSVDPRFAHMLRDKSFTSRAKVDRYGRALSQTKDRNLERLYKVEKTKTDRKPRVEVDSEDDDEDDSKEEDEEEEEDEVDEDEEGGVSLIADEDVEEELARVGGKLDPARTGGYSESSSEEETSDESDADEEEEEESGLAARQVEDVPEGEISSRLAAVNLDWDNIRAVDLMVVLQSFAPTGEKINKVTIYPSEFGRERMEREEIEGPPKELFHRKAAKSKDDFGGFSDDDEEHASEQGSDEEDEQIKKSLLQEDQGEDFDPVQLRKYQLERLRYFYAVVDCSSTKCALELYRSVDNTEYLSTANFFDLRFVPNETDFSDDKPRDACHKIPEDYAPNEFSTDALRNSNVKLTWDADDTNRKETQKRAFSRAEIDENDIKAYLASDSSDDDDVIEPEVVDATAEDDDANQPTEPAPKVSKKEAERMRMRAALGLGAKEAPRKSKDEPMGDMEITFSSALGTVGGSVFENEPIPDETTKEKYMRKERERKARRKENRKARQIEVGEADGEPVAKPKEKPDLGFDDPFFTAPANDQKAAQAARKEEKRKKRAELEAKEAQTAGQKAELEEILGDGKDALDAGIVHFDIDALRKAEKVAKRRGKKIKLRASEKQALEAKAKDTFQMDIEDSRFKGVFENPAFALDPNSALFSKTEGTQKLLEAGRQKRSRDMDGEPDEPVPEKKRKGKSR